MTKSISRVSFHQTLIGLPAFNKAIKFTEVVEAIHPRNVAQAIFEGDHDAQARIIRASFITPEEIDSALVRKWIDYLCLIIEGKFENQDEQVRMFTNEMYEFAQLSAEENNLEFRWDKAASSITAVTR